jgi:hypothetical protein
LVVALLVMAVLLLLGTSFLTVSSTELEIARNAHDATQAFYLAESGLARVRRDVLAQFSGPYRAGCPQFPVFADLRRPVLLTGEPLGVPGQRLDVDGSATCGPPGGGAFYPLLDAQNQPGSAEGATWRSVPYATPATAETYRVEVRNATLNSLDVRVSATAGAATRASRQLEATLRVERFSPAEHAVFVDGGVWPLRSGGVQGRFLFAGPVFAKGWSGSYPALRLGEGGASDQIVNWYKAIDPGLQAVVPPLAPTAGETADLGGVVRAFQGPVEIGDPTASVGEPETAGNQVKEPLAAVYTNHGFTGAPGAAGVHADSGPLAPFDLPRELVAFPELAGPYSGPPLPLGAIPPSHDAFLRAGALAIDGGLIIDAATPSFSYPPGLADISQCAASCLIYTSGQGGGGPGEAAPPTLQIQGIVWVRGDALLGGHGAQRLPGIRYKGAGSLYARSGLPDGGVPAGSITITADLLPPAGFPPDAGMPPGEGRFPADHRLGLVASAWMLVGDWTTGQELAASPPPLRIAATVHADYGMYNYWPYQIAGSVVARYLYIWRGASIYYVPDLVRHRPPGMPGVVPPKAAAPFFVKTAAWRDVMP